MRLAVVPRLRLGGVAHHTRSFSLLGLHRSVPSRSSCLVGIMLTNPSFYCFMSRENCPWRRSRARARRRPASRDGKRVQVLAEKLSGDRVEKPPAEFVTSA